MVHLLPREVLKWLQSLELSHSIHNSRRDFSNGYLIAEIFSWYYPQEIQMHMFQNGTSIESKIGNWALLQKFFNRQKLDIPKEETEATIHCKAGAAALLVQRIYMILTHRSLPTFLETDVDFSDNSYQQKLPFHARCTASKAIKNNISDTELYVDKDTIACTKKAEGIVRLHVNNRHLQRIEDPDRFGIKPTLGQRSPRKRMVVDPNEYQESSNHAFSISDCFPPVSKATEDAKKTHLNEIHVKQHLVVSSLSACG